MQFEGACVIGGLVARPEILIVERAFIEVLASAKKRFQVVFAPQDWLTFPGPLHSHGNLISGGKAVPARLKESVDIVLRLPRGHHRPQAAPVAVPVAVPVALPALRTGGLALARPPPCTVESERGAAGSD